MTNEELAAIRARCEAATPAPWVVAWPQADGTHSVVIVTQGTFGAGAWSETTVAIAMNPGTLPVPENAEFLAHAREDVPALLAEIDRLRAENAALRADIKMLLVDELEADR